MMAASCVVMLMHIFLAAYMLYMNRKWRRQAAERGEVLSEAERSRLAEAVGMVGDEDSPTAYQFSRPMLRRTKIPTSVTCSENQSSGQ